MASRRILQSNLSPCTRAASTRSALTVPPIARSVSTSTSRYADDAQSSSSSSSASSKQKQGILTSLLHGSKIAQADGLTTKSHSQAVARGKYIHEIQRQ